VQVPGEENKEINTIKIKIWHYKTQQALLMFPRLFSPTGKIARHTVLRYLLNAPD